MKEENKRCWSCGRFKRYYTKGFCNFQKEDIGFCSAKEKTVSKDDSCKMWNYLQRVRNMRKQMAINAIVDIRSRIEVIEEVLTEAKDLKKIKDEDA